MRRYCAKDKYYGSTAPIRDRGGTGRYGADTIVGRPNGTTGLPARVETILFLFHGTAHSGSIAPTWSEHYNWNIESSR